MKAHTALLLSFIVLLPACSTFHDDRPLSRVDRGRGPLVLDGPERQGIARRNVDEPGIIARTLPWNWGN